MMTVQEQILRLLREHSDGMSIPEMEKHLGIGTKALYRALKKMPQAWIDRWENPPKTGRPRTVWCVVPEDCPPPRTKKR